jgi:hypothetical protein
MELREHQHLAINNTEMLIGEITYINIKDDIVSDDGYVAVDRAGSVLVSSLDTYHSSDLLSRLSYARPGTQAVELDDKLDSRLNK